MKKILIFIANFNQAKEIENFLVLLKKAWDPAHVVVVDDGSTDGSDLIAESMGFPVLRHGSNKGVGSAIRTGYEYGRKNNYTHIVMMSSNGKMIPKEIHKVIAPILSNEADYVTGSRYLEGGARPGLSLFRRIAIPLFSLSFSPFLGRRVSDITCGFRCYALSFVFSPPVNIYQSWLDRYEMEYYVHYWAYKQKLRIVEVPVVIKYDHLAKHRISKIKPIVGWWSMVRPLLFLSLGIKK